MQDSWRERIEQGKDLLSLGHSKTLSFSGDGGGGQAPWKPSSSLTESSNGSASSAVISTSDGAAKEKATPENSEQSGSVLKEHDYIGMAEVSSASSEKAQCNTENPEELNLKDTDLCLGLGLGLTPSKKAEPVEDAEKTISFAFSQHDGLPKTMVDANISTRAFLEGAPAEQRSLQTPWTNASNMNVPKVSQPQQVRDFQSPQISLPAQDLSSMPRGANAYQGARVVGPPPTLKNGVKRGYTEAMSDVARFNMTPEARAVAAMAIKNGEGDAKALPKQPQSAFLPSWAAVKPTTPTPWHVGLEQAAAHSFGPNFGPSKAVPAPRAEKPAADCAATAYKGSHDLPDNVQESATNEAPPSKDRVVGWPPIRSYRKNTLAKPMEMFVKVNMDGVTVGRKVDLNAHNSYEGLLSALEEMFQPSNNAQGTPQAACGSNANDTKQFRLLHGSDFVLTYEDKDGDWMLVGDVPWSMFTNTVRRLRITRGPEASGPSLRGSEKNK